MPRSHRLSRFASLVAAFAVVATGLGAAPTVQAIGLTWTVDSTGDTGDQNTGNLICRTFVGTCTLRAAIQQANAINPGIGNHHTIILPAGTITIFLLPAGEDDAKGGDFDIKRSMTIRGEGRGATIIQGSTTSAEDAFDRIFDIQALGTEFVLQDLTVRRGNAHLVQGGAIRVNAASAAITLSNVALIGNRAFDDAGGAIAARSGPLTILDSRIANTDSKDGPVVSVDGGNLTIRRTTFANNDTWNGAVFLRGDGTGLIDRSTFYGQQTNGSTAIAVRVGADSTDTSALVIRNSTFAGNVGEGDSPVIFGDRGATLEIASSTIAGNTGYGITGAALASIRNTIVAANSKGNCLEAVPSLGHNLDSGTTCGLDGPGDIEDGRPRLADLGDYGGPTATRKLNTGSDAIDAGASCPDIDQRGVARPKDGDGDGSARCDIGAYEAPKVVLPSPSPTPTATPTKAPTAPPTAAPTATPTVAPTTDVTAPPVTQVPSGGPADTAAPSATAAPTTAPSTDGQPAPTSGPGATTAPAPTESPGGGDALLWIVALIVAVVVAFGLILGRRRRAQPPG